MIARLPQRRGIDGLRALAVVAVLLYHGDVSWAPGGFLGVDVFFTISGYLITSLLLAELAADGRIALRRFWIRRARRLLPAVAVLLVGVTIAALAGAHDAVDRLRGDVAAAAMYSSNWWQIVRGETYFDTLGRPPLLRHLWSLAVEEQLYLVLPLAMTAAARLGWLRHRRLVAIGSLVAAGTSSLLLAVLWQSDDPSRAWFGTDTRSAPLLVGVAGALWWPMRERPRWSGVARAWIDVAALVALTGIGVLVAVLGERDAGLPRWGFPVTALLSGVSIVAITSPSSRVGRLLGVRPLRWIGLRSYAIYLWHWPAFVLLRSDRDVVFDGWLPLAARLLVTGLLAELSWRLVEQPFRTGAVGRGWRELRQHARVRVAVAGTASMAVLSAALGVGLSTAATETPALLATVAVSPTTATTLLHIPRTTTVTSATSTTDVLAPSTTAPTPPPTDAPAAPTGAVLAVGDSVMLSARDTLLEASQGRIYVDAAVGRQVEDGLTVLQGYKDQGTLQQLSALVVHLGTNGPMSDDLFNHLASIVAGVPRVVLLNVRVPKSWEERSNAAINGGVTRFDFMRLADWYAESSAPGALATDGVHPSPSGARIYSYVIFRQLEGAPPPPPPPPPPSTTTTTGAPATSTTTTTTTTTTAPVVTLPAGQKP